MNPMNINTIAAINSALLFTANRDHECETPALRPWQYVQMSYEGAGLVPPAVIPNFASFEEAELWMCLDSRYNDRLRERSLGRMAG